MQRITAALDGTLKMEDWHNLGLDYDRTLMAWHGNFMNAWPRFSAEFGDRFYRLWSYYLLMFAGVFRARHLEPWQIVLSSHGAKGGYRRPFWLNVGIHPGIVTLSGLARVRGNPGQHRVGADPAGSIPARAGKPP